MADDETGTTKPDLTDQDVVRRVLKENHVDIERALVVLIGTLVDRHLDCELRKMGRRPPRTPGNDRTNALTAAMDALWEYSNLNAKAQEELAGEGMEDDPNVSDEDYVDGLVAGDLARIQRVLMNLLTECQFFRERQAGIDGDDDEERPWMRLVRD